MNYFLSSKNCFNIYKCATEKYLISEFAILEQMAIAILKNIDLKHRQTFAVICGKGFNGAIGLTLSKLLIANGKIVDIYLLNLKEYEFESFNTILKTLKKLTNTIYEVETIEEMSFFQNNLNKVNTIIDAIVGVEIKYDIDKVASYVIDFINQKTTYKISIDIPSGMNPDSGKTMGFSVDSDIVITYEAFKEGMKNSYIKSKTIIEKIGIPKKIIFECI
ncbi:MAG: NAD(P)H-hydrate epimerase [Peptoniphilaceae bacterium]|nr:NAD(P)H-hydrate epimerase [Peptoniphilaceae bacterium]MDD7383902.1 NAD(P)H-hydrate epimerase [Peptoniphilaceae bacterium]MDY3738043.1 NAD(P)H-hydrate epimerase [Peptoniphilaceae bacterium]